MGEMKEGKQPELYPTWEQQSKVQGYRIETLNALSAPKGVRYVCELTGVAAGVKMITPFTSLYYGSKEDAILSWEGIMHKLLPLVSQLRAKPVIIGSEEERQKREYSILMSKRALVDLTQRIAQRFLIKGEYELSIPGAMQCLSFSKEVYGDDTIDLVPAYLLLAQCHLGMRNFRPVQEFLGLANWSVLKTPDCPNEIKAQLERTFGKLCAAEGKHAEAAEHLAKDIYWTSLASGPEHVKVSVGYFNLACVFDAQHRVEAALALYDKVVDIWYKYLSAVRMSGDDTDPLSEAQCEEAMQMLLKILDVRRQFLGDNHIATGEAHFTLGLLRLLMERELDVAKQSIATAHSLYVSHLGPDHPSTVDVKDLLGALA
ncbi:Zinc finger MYND domain-containing protein 12 [Hondaea fermentalgiana]|uniref:Zinc finger MYND domain-containing protein 12 n=1 Tax=Hondaea fermentalgiana TaxID=2315210 RepID=A0A2R5GGV2_9STRA|nr:Zinc finger MYND domain-containing protein 12 [Hondaea fermentalgiana]|eukprot:GBG28988.1 Zinc finger MYND domain-containing protein 12 [Hondaea fermentalgiana]